MLTLLLVAVLMQSPSPAPGTPAGTGIIRGRVTDQESGQPLARASVSLMTSSGPPRSTRADADGRYAFTALPSGRYTVSANAAAFRATHVYGYHTRPGSTSVEPIALKDGEVRTGVDIMLPRAFAISGRVVDDTGEPVARVQIQIQQVDSGRSYGGSTRSTDDLGRFRIIGFSAGRYALCAEVPDRVIIDMGSSTIERLVSTCNSADASQQQGPFATIRGADVDGVEIRLPRSRTFTISGVVLESTGQPADKPMVSFTTYTTHGSSSSVTTAGSDGRFVIRNVLPGHYSVRAQFGGPELPNSGRELELAYAPLTVGSDNISGLVLTMAKAVSVTGRIVFEGTNTPPARNPGYGPMLLRVALEGSSVHRFDDSGSGQVFDDMTFQLTKLFGRRVLTVLNIPSGWMLKSLMYRGKDVTDVPTDFQPVPDPSQLEVLISNRGAVVTGRVLDDSGNPVRGRVLMVPTERARWLALDQATSVLSPATTGSFVLPPQRVGDYAIVAVDSAEALPLLQDATFFERIVKSGQSITLTENDRRTVDLRVTKLSEER
jgi:protocatechuate 3,4-dioxygenase beta subunit